MAISSISSTASANYYTKAALAGPVDINTALSALKVNPRIKVSIKDTSANISNNLETLNKYVNNINVAGIEQTDPTAVMEVSATQLAKFTTLLGKFSTNYKINVSNVAASSVTSMDSNSHVNNFSITDTSLNISASLDNIKNKIAKLDKVTVSTPSSYISLTADQFVTDAAVISKIKNSYSLSVRNATAAQASTYQGNFNIKSVAVSDTASEISAHLDDLQQLGLSLTEVKSTDNAAISISANQIESDALVIGKLYKGYQLAVTSSNINQAIKLMASKKMVSIDIVDSSANISNNLDLLKKLGNSLTSICITDTNNALTMNSTQYAAASSTLEKIDSTSSAYKIDIQKATASEARAFKTTNHIRNISIYDSNSNISSQWENLITNSRISDIYITGANNTLSIKNDMLDTNMLATIRTNYGLDINSVAISDVDALVKGNARINSVSVTGNAKDVTDNLTTLDALGSRLKTITRTDTATTTLNLTASEWNKYANLLTKITSGYAINISGVSAANAKSIASDKRIQSVSVTDTAAAISSKIDSLHYLGTQLTSIIQSDTTAISLNANQWKYESSTLSKIGKPGSTSQNLGTGYTLSIKNATTDQLANLLLDTKITSIDFADTNEKIVSNLDALQSAITANAQVNFSIRQTNTSQPLAITYDQYTNDATALAKITSNYSLSLSGAPIAQAIDTTSNLYKDKSVSSLQVQGTHSSIETSLSALNSLGDKVTAITQTDASTDDLSLSLDQWTAYGKTIYKIQSGVHASISGVPVSGVTSLLLDSRVKNISISDSVSNISTAIDQLNNLGPKLVKITPSNPSSEIIVSMDQLNRTSGLLGKIDGSYSLAVKNATAVDAQNLLGADYTHVTSVYVADSSSNIASKFDSLSSNNKLVEIKQTGIATPLILTNAQRIAGNASTFAKISGGYTLNISDATVGTLSDILSNSSVTGVSLSGSAFNIVDNLTALSAASNKLQTISITDTSPATLAMTYSQWNQYQVTLAKITSPYKVSISDVSATNAGSVASDQRVISLSVLDSTQNINTNLDSLQRLGAQLTTITVNDVGTPLDMSVTAYQYHNDAKALSKISGANYSLSITGANVLDAAVMEGDSQVSNFNLRDFSYNIGNSITDLNSYAKLLSNSINVIDSTVPISLSADLYISSSATLAKITNSYLLEVKDASTSMASELQSNSHVSSFNIKDTSSNIGSALLTNSSIADMSKISSIAVTSDDGAIDLTQSQYELLSDSISQITGSFRLKISDVLIGDLSTTLSEPHVISASLSASSSDISANFDGLSNLGDSLTSITISNASTPIALTYEQWSNGSDTLSKIINATYHLALVSVSAAAATSASAQANVDSVSVSDGGSNISSKFDALSALGSALDGVEVYDHVPILITQSQFDSSSDLIDKFMGDHRFSISDATA